MEGKKQVSSSSSFTSDLFGSKKSPPSYSTGIFASILSPPSVVGGRNASTTEVIGSWQKQHTGNLAWSNKQGTAAPSTGGASSNIPKKDRSYILQEEIADPCNLSSSIYYGGQDIYSHSPSTHASGSYPVFKKDGAEDDPNGNNTHGASRGNWWQGSLYY